MITIFFLSLSVIFLSLQNYFLHRDFRELRHDLNDLTCRFINFKVITSVRLHRIDGDDFESVKVIESDSLNK